MNGRNKETLTFEPYLSMNDYDGLAHALLAGVGIGELPPLVQPELVRDGRLVEVIPKWRFRTFNLSVVHLGNRYTRGRCARSRNSRHKWRQSSFQSFLIEKNLY